MEGRCHNQRAFQVMKAAPFCRLLYASMYFNGVATFKTGK